MIGPRLGAHVSIAGGTPCAVDRAVATGCETLQIFTKSSNQWRSIPLGDDEVAAFRTRAAVSGIGPIFAHTSYLINLAAADLRLRKRSVAALADELLRADRLGLHGVILHPGAHTTASETDGIRWIADGIGEARQQQTASAVLLLELTAGQGTMLGYSFEQLRAMLDRLDDASQVAICLDTCHLLAAGYDIVSEAGYERVFTEFDAVLGFDLLTVFHLNDSIKPLGSRVDRHAAIGHGCIGTEPFRRLVQDARFRHVPMVIETPKERGRPASDTGADSADLKNLALLKRLREGVRG